MPSQSPYTQVRFTSPVQSDKQLLGATATDTAHQFFLQSPLVKRGQSKAKPDLTSPLLGTAATCPAFYSPSPFSGLLRALSVPCLGAAFSPCQAGNTSANMSSLQKALLALSPGEKALWVNSSLPPGSFRIFQTQVILGF